MPLTRVSLKRGKSAEYKQAILGNVYKAMRETFNVPEDDFFMIVHEHESDEFMFGKSYLNVNRSDDLIIIQITVSDTRSIEQKKALYARIADLLAQEPGTRPEDVFISLIEVKKENWSLGCGIAQYA
jgi:4-oxalocrotonate tautomerase